jgi:cellulose biosynthesis protein BcsQ
MIGLASSVRSQAWAFRGFLMKTIVFFNNTGGVGKTTLCSNIATHFARAGLRPILVDCDPRIATSIRRTKR